MAENSENGIGSGLQRFAAINGDMIVNRPPRRRLTGVEFDSQICRLLLDKLDATANSSYVCKVADVSDEGFGIVCDAAKHVPHPFKPGAHMTLQETNGKLSRVEVRWVRNGRLGLRRLAARPH